MTDAKTIEFKNVSKSFEGRTPTLENITFDIRPGEFVFLTGASGSGKTTILNMIYRFTLPDSGLVYHNGANIAKKQLCNARHRSQIGYMFQSSSLLERRSVEYNVSLPQRILGIKRRMRKKRLDTVLNLCCIDHLRKSSPVSISGGEKQLTALARAIVNSPGLILVDEPTANLDRRMGLIVINQLMRLNEKGATIIVCSHDPALIKTYGTRVLLIKNKQITDYR